MTEVSSEFEALPRPHSGYEHIQDTGHALALSSVALSNCAECDWSSDPPVFAGPHRFPQRAIDGEVIAWKCEACGTWVREFGLREPDACPVDWRSEAALSDRSEPS